MATESAIVARVRAELADQGEAFQNVVRGDGKAKRFELSVGQVSLSSFRAYIITAGATPQTIILSAGTDYTVDTADGVITLTTALADEATLVVEGTSYSLFTDEEVMAFISDALAQHTHGRETQIRYRDGDGFIRYGHAPISLDSLPPVEDYLLVLLATIEALWTLATDASLDVDITTAEGTHVPRGQRFEQVRRQIEGLQERYNTLAQQLNVGLNRIEMSNLRRVSRTTNRLVPEFVEREYDDNTLPTRILPPLDHAYSDPDGPPSPIAAGWG